MQDAPLHLWPVGRGSFDELVVRHRPACLALAFGVLRDRHLAEDAVQEAMLDAWRLRDAFDAGRGSQQNWLLMLTHRRAVDRVRREHRQGLPLATVEARLPAQHSDAPAETAWQSARARALHNALPRLSAPQREVVVLAYFAGHSQSEIAELVGVPLGTVKSRTTAAMRLLRTLLGRTCSEAA